MTSKLLLLGLLVPAIAFGVTNRTLNATKIQNGSGSVSIPSAVNVTASEIGYLSGVTSSIQSQFSGLTTTGVADTAATAYKWMFLCLETQ